jgi:hypothetical protein
VGGGEGARGNVSSTFTVGQRLQPVRGASCLVLGYAEGVRACGGGGWCARGTIMSAAAGGAGLTIHN